MKKTAAALALLLTAACSSLPMNSSAKDSSAGAGSSAQAIATKSAYAPNYILFSSPNAVRSVDYSTSVYGLNLKGTMTTKGFIPAGTIEGRGSFCAEGKDWLSLYDLSQHKASDKSPEGSYVLGCVSASGFTPASRDAVVVQ